MMASSACPPRLDRRSLLLGCCWVAISLGHPPWRQGIVGEQGTVGGTRDHREKEPQFLT